jgi:hypothetical protein
MSAAAEQRKLAAFIRPRRTDMGGCPEASGAQRNEPNALKAANVAMPLLA